jgi:sugar/nucleoside kinase (ribokinase family)
VTAAFPGGVEIELLEAPVTTTFENVYGHGQSRRQRAPALAPALPFRAGLLEGVDVLHLGPLFPDDVDSTWYEHDGVSRALDVQGLTRRIVDGEVAPAADARLGRWCAQCRWLKGSVREWSLVESAFGGLPRLARDCERLVTRGIEGGDVDAVYTHRWRASPPVHGCDPTGAGDVYFAAYLAGRAGGSPVAAAADDAARFTSAFLERSVR